MARKKSITKISNTGVYPVRNFENLSRDDGTTGNSVLYNNGELHDFDDDGNYLGKSTIPASEMEQYSNASRADVYSNNNDDVDSSPVMNSSTFAKAFKDARNAGLSKFTWKGREYNTSYANEIKNASSTNKNRKRRSLTFSQAFANARKQGANTFTWKGKKYGTKLRGE